MTSALCEHHWQFLPETTSTARIHKSRLEYVNVAMCQSEAICEAASFICSLKINETGLMSLRLNILSFELNFMNIRSRFYQWPHPFYGGGRDVDPNEGNHLKQGSRAGWTEQYFSTKRMTRVLGYIGSIRCPAAWEAGKQAGQA